MAALRKTGHDIAPKVKPITATKPGLIPPNKLAVVDQHGSIRGVVGRKASAGVAMRFGVFDAQIGKHEGKDAWIGRTK